MRIKLEYNFLANTLIIIPHYPNEEEKILINLKDLTVRLISPESETSIEVGSLLNSPIVL